MNGRAPENMLAILVDRMAFDVHMVDVFHCQSTAMIAYEGQPTLHNQLMRLEEQGFRHFIVATSSHDCFIEQHLALLAELKPDLNYELVQLEELPADVQHTLLEDLFEILAQRDDADKADVLWVQNLRHIIDLQSEWLHCPAPVMLIRASAPINHSHQVLGYMIDPHLWQDSAITQLDPDEREQTCADLQMTPVSTSFVPYAEIRVRDWEDVTYLDGEPSARHSTIAARGFNRLTIDMTVGRVTKQSSQTTKINNEIRFYQALPKALQLYFPRLLSARKGLRTSSYSIEFYPFKCLSQYFVYYPMPQSRWVSAFDSLLAIHDKFCVSSPTTEQAQPYLDQSELFNFYWQKTVLRMQEARQQQLALAKLMNQSWIKLNGRYLSGFKRLEKMVRLDLWRICAAVKPGFVHGDLCFSNILFEPHSTLIRLIDPRGEFMGLVNWGDPRYDLAKLLHSVHGRYDFIIHDLFEVKNLSAHCYELRIACRPDSAIIQAIFLEKLDNIGRYPLRDLLLLEALLFLSMLPLHSDHPERQLAFFMIGLTLLNDLYGEPHHAPVH
jgi:hypothetical protein